MNYRSFATSGRCPYIDVRADANGIAQIVHSGNAGSGNAAEDLRPFTPGFFAAFSCPKNP